MVENVEILNKIMIEWVVELMEMDNKIEKMKFMMVEEVEKIIMMIDLRGRLRKIWNRKENWGKFRYNYFKWR